MSGKVREFNHDWSVATPRLPTGAVGSVLATAFCHCMLHYILVLQ